MDSLFQALQSIGVEVLVAVSAIIGGIAKYINELLVSDRKFAALTFLGHAIVSGWCGFTTALFVGLWWPEAAPAVAGVAGWMGSKSIDLAQNYLTKKLGV